MYADGPIPEWALLGEYDNGSASGRGRTEYLWLPTEDGGAIPVGFLRGGKLYAIHPDHLGTPRLVTNEDNEPVWQWPYSAFGDNKPTGVLKATANPNAALANQPQLLRATTPLEFNLRMPGQYHDAETGLAYNYWRSYCPACGRYVRTDPIGLEGGLNRFDYVFAQPLSNTDPHGLNPLAGALTGAGLGSAAGPVGTFVGAAVGAGIGAWMGWKVFGPMLQEKTPNEGPPGTWGVNPGSGQERLYGPEGQPEVDIDWDHDRKGADGHPSGTPHGHNWDWTQRPPRGLPVPVSPWPRGRACPR